MLRTARFQPSRSAQRLILWCLLLALPVYGLSSTMSVMLGARHVHREVVAVGAAMDGWQDFRRASRVADAASRVHTHASWLRHHHAVGDDTVLAIDGGHGASQASEPASDSGAPTLQMFVPAGVIELGLIETTRSRWPRDASASFESRDTERLDRPPRA